MAIVTLTNQPEIFASREAVFVSVLRKQTIADHMAGVS